MTGRPSSRCTAVLLLAGLCGAHAAPTVSRLTPPSELFASGHADPIVARFLPGQRFDLQATLRPDAGQRITQARFFVDGRRVDAPVALRDCSTGCVPGVPASALIATVRALSVDRPGRHEFGVVATQEDRQSVTARGNFEVVPFSAATGPKVRNLIILLGDGMGAAHRTAARIVKGGYAQGKVLAPLAMDTFPATALVKTASLNSVITDSAPGMTSYVSGNKNNNNEEGVFPDDTVDAFDNPRIEYLSEFLHRTQGKALGIVTTADVFDATPAGNAVHTSNRGAGTGIVDQFFDDRDRTGLTVLMGGGRKWFLPAATPGSARADASDYALSATQPHTAELAQRWRIAPGALDKDRDLIHEFEAAGFRYAASKTELDASADADKLLGLFALSNMNVALDKIDGRRGASTARGGNSPDRGGATALTTPQAEQTLTAPGAGPPPSQGPAPLGGASTASGGGHDTGPLPSQGPAPLGGASTASGGRHRHASVVDDFGFPDQPMLDEMTQHALQVLERRRDGFVLMVEGASIDKQSHAMDTERWIVDTIEFDRAVQVAQDFARRRGDTLVIVTADHECSGAALIGGSLTTDAALRDLAAARGAANLRDKVVGVYEHAGFPAYHLAADGYPETTDVDHRLLVGYGANADRYEDWRTNATPLRDPQQPFAKTEPLKWYAPNPVERDDAMGAYLVTGQVPGESAVHTATDVPLSAFGPGALMFTGVIDNTDVFFKLAQAALRGVTAPADSSGARRPR